MRCACLLLALTTGLAAQVAISLKANREGHLLVLEDVSLNGVGLFRMAVDTGNASCLIRPEIAHRLAAPAVYLVDHVTAAGVHRLPVVRLDQVTTGRLTERCVEAVVGEVRLDSVDGVLGQSWLARHDYLLDYRNSRVVLDGSPPARGLMVALRSADGRPSISAQVDGRDTELVLDSGTSTVVLFNCPLPPRLPRMAMLRTNGDSASAREAITRIALPGERERTTRAVCVSTPDHALGLLPATVFSEVFVSNRHVYVRLIR